MITPNTTTYAAITIGPIYDAITMTSTPAGLWAASYLFSHISRRLCELIDCEGLISAKEDIIMPYFSADEQKIDGIGRYPDRIIFKPKDEETVLDNLEDVFSKIAKEIASVFDGEHEDWFKQYLQLHALCFQSESNAILDL